MEDFEPDSWSAAVAAATLVVVMSSTYGPGAPPGTANKFIAWTQNGNGEAKDAFEGMPQLGHKGHWSPMRIVSYMLGGTIPSGHEVDMFAMGSRVSAQVYAVYLTAYLGRHTGICGHQLN
jgi:hypothetical protein